MARRVHNTQRAARVPAVRVRVGEVGLLAVKRRGDLCRLLESIRHDRQGTMAPGGLHPPRTGLAYPGDFL